MGKVIAEPTELIRIMEKKIMICPKCKGELKCEEITVKSRFGKKLDPPEDFIVYWCENPSCRYGFRERKVSKKSLKLREKLIS